MYPYSKELQSAKDNFVNGNFGLWFNKLVEINEHDNFKKFIDKEADQKRKIPAVIGHETRLIEVYNKLNKKTIDDLLIKKNKNQKSNCDYFKTVGYDYKKFKVTLKSNLITGIGQTNAGEVGMVFDYTIGIPYIPASSIKGVVRYTHNLSLIENNKIIEEMIEIDKKNGLKYFNDEHPNTNNPELFGTQTKRGGVIFLDAYPETTPELHIDIMNPHYGEYYNGDKPPADYLSPNPIKFLTVKPGVNFIFRILIDKKLEAEIKEMAIKALEKALFEEGIGAKTAIGYGLFEKYDPDKKQINKQTSSNLVLNKETSSLKAGNIIKIILLEEKTKKGGWKAQCKDYPEISGPIINSNIIGSEKKAGDEIKVRIRAISGNNSSFEVVS